ncbi:MAG: glucans biosynthesis glucosyltransferase MdoH [Brevundimonas sp.]|nr:MAG: glucans biosynthesis glucosyltransferase MdoH [Brevundimonas sp.]
MNRLASFQDLRANAVELTGDEWLPDAAPLVMPRQSMDAVVDAPTPATSPETVRRRRWILAAGTFFITALAAITPVVMYARGGLQPLEAVAFGLFAVLITSIACWFFNSAVGLSLLLRNRDQEDLDFSAWPPQPVTRTALLMPLYHEDATAALNRLAALDASLHKLGVSEHFDLFVLSDSRKAPSVAAEHTAFTLFRLRAHSAAFYRRREENLEAKAGNVAEWTRRFGGAYDFMVVLDADSTMAGDTVLRLVDAMERNPGVGLIQTAPTIIKAQTLFARVSQFGVRLYGRVAAAGLAWWTGSEGSYWGHNAILRVQAFAQAAGLPVLEGVKPWGGHIMSHDVVEAALLRRAGWAVHVTAALDGSCEETPPTITDFIRREHRWCQGNLQHAQLLFAKGLHPMSRLQLAMGCMAYLASPLWLGSLVAGLAIELQYPVDWTSFFYFLHPQFTPFMLASLLSGVLLMGPKIMGAVVVLNRPRERRAFGGGRRVVKGMLAEIGLSAILAPIFMVANTVAVMQFIRGRDAGWAPQQREADGLSWGDAFRAMGWQIVAGLGFVGALCVRPDLTVFFLPIVLPLLLSPAIAVWTSRVSSGEAFERNGLLVVPAESDGVAVPTVPHAARPAALYAVAGGR